jgi:hypothetical protein
MTLPTSPGRTGPTRAACLSRIVRAGFLGSVDADQDFRHVGPRRLPPFSRSQVDVARAGRG